MRTHSATKWVFGVALCVAVVAAVMVSIGPQAGKAVPEALPLAVPPPAVPPAASQPVPQPAPEPVPQEVPQVPQPVPQDDAKEFQGRVQKYLAIQKKALAKVPSIPRETPDAALIGKHQLEVADTIRMLRLNAMPGEIFTPWLRTTISAAVKQQVKGRAGADAKATILGEGNPNSAESPAAVKLTINGAYPEKAPLSTVPPSVLMVLPVLPEGVEYRFVGRTLILRDTKANIVVDILPNAL